MNGVTYVSDSSNSKIAGSRRADATYASIESTCPTSCELKNNGCYGQLGNVGFQNNRLNDQAKGLSALDVAKAEAQAIDDSYKRGQVPFKRDLRLHVVGDSRTIRGSKLINQAVGRWKKRGGGDCWTYTHSWSKVPRDSWSNVSILASVINTKQANKARSKGYATAIVVSEFSSNKPFLLEGSDIKWIPCVAQTKDVACTDCRLCFNADRLYQKNMGIAFEAHGVRKNTVKRRLQVIK